MEMITTVDTKTGLIMKIDWKPVARTDKENERDAELRKLMKKGNAA